MIKFLSNACLFSLKFLYFNDSLWSFGIFLLLYWLSIFSSLISHLFAYFDLLIKFDPNWGVWEYILFLNFELSSSFEMLLNYLEFDKLLLFPPYELVFLFSFCKISIALSALSVNLSCSLLRFPYLDLFLAWPKPYLYEFEFKPTKELFPELI